MKVGAVQADSGAGSTLGTLVPALEKAYPSLEVGPVDLRVLKEHDLVFVAVPSGASHSLVAELHAAGVRVVDLGADFRLRDPSAYEKWYGFTHSSPHLLAEAVYGLPELNREAITGAQLIAAPGCYVTAACLGLAPLLKEGVVSPAGVIVDGLSGTSGAGKAPTAELHHPLVNERVVPYGLLTHRHTPEMEQVLGAEVLFTPHLVPMTRGILATCYARVVGSAVPSSSGEVVDLLAEAYEGEPFVAVSRGTVSTADAYGSNVAHLTARYHARTGHVIVLAAIDNLVKGGSGQAIQAANLACGFEETAGLPQAGLTP